MVSLTDPPNGGALYREYPINNAAIVYVYIILNGVYCNRVPLVLMLCRLKLYSQLI